MRQNRVKQILAAGGVAIGTGVFEFGTTGIGRIVANAGADYVVYDMEHTGWSIETIRSLMATTRSADVVPIVRPPAIDHHLISRVLDVGAMGLMLPMVEHVEQAQMIVRSAMYPPIGRRGAAFGVAHDDYLGGDVAEKMAGANREIFVIALIETVAGVENVSEIAAVAGIDCLMIGHFDLTASLGIPAQFDHPAFQSAVDRVLAACAEHGKAAGASIANAATAEQWLRRGCRIISYGIDIPVYQQALATGIAAIREFAETVATARGGKV